MKYVMAIAIICAAVAAQAGELDDLRDEMRDEIFHQSMIARYEALHTQHLVDSAIMRAETARIRAQTEAMRAVATQTRDFGN